MRRGFTLIELLLVIAIMLAVGVGGSIFYSRFLMQNAVANTTDQLVQALRKAQFYAMMSRKSNTSGWGVSYSPGSLTLYQGTGSQTIGYQTIGSFLDTGDSNWLDAMKLQMGSTGGSVVSASVHVGNVDSAPYNQFQFGIYTDAGGVPGSLITNSGTGTLLANAWNSLPISATLGANTIFWLVYNTNGRTTNVNNMHYDNAGSPIMAFSNSGVTFGTWPAGFGPATTQDFQLSMYVVVTGGSTALNETYSIPANVTITGLTAIDFSRISGLPSVGGVPVTNQAMTVTGQGNTKQVSINSQGVVSR